MDKHVVTLATEGHRARLHELAELVPVGYVIHIEPPTRTNEQNAKIHAMLQDIAVQVDWQGKKHNLYWWKRMTTFSFYREIGKNVEMWPALDGKGMDIIPPETSRMSVKIMRDYVEWLYALGSEHNVKWSEPLPEWLTEE